MIHLGRAYETMNQFEPALEIYEQYQQRNPSDTDIYYNLAMMYGRTGKDGPSHYNFGIYFKKKGKPDRAIYHLQEALKYYPPESDRAAEINAEIEELKKPPKKPAVNPDTDRPPARKPRV